MSNREFKKFKKRTILQIDVSAIPNGMSLDTWFEIFRNHNIMLWNSENWNKVGVVANPNKTANTPFKFFSKTRIKCPYKIKVADTI
jgi:hypothetical protein